MATATAAHDERERVELRLIDGFEIAVDNRPVDLPLAAQRVIAFVALHERPVLRTHVAGALWGDRPDERAGACLRSALWRSNQAFPLVAAGRTHLKLDQAVRVDAIETASLARGVLQGDAAGKVGVQALSGRLLPDWYDDWVLLERERLRQLCLDALEQLSASLLIAGQTALAIESALAVVLAEPLRETAYGALIEAHLVAGNRPEALRQYRRYEQVLSDELGLEPSVNLQQRLRRCGLLAGAH